jgi:curved DNA-binding protein CbpA
MADPYKILGVTPKSSAEEIKRAYRRLAKKLHPDLNPGDKRIEAQFKELTAAYDLLGDPDRRARYDRGELDESGQPRAPRSWQPGGPPNSGRRQQGRGFGLEDDEDSFAEDLFKDISVSGGASAAASRCAVPTFPTKPRLISSTRHSAPRSACI